MLGSTILKLSDPYEYQIAVGRAGNFKTIVTEPGIYQSELAFVDLHHIGLQQGRISLARIVQGATEKNLCMFAFLAADNQAHITFNGTEPPQSHIVFCCPGDEYVTSTSAECCWSGITLPPETLASASQVLAGYEIIAPKASQVIRTPPPLMGRLLNLHRLASQLAATAPGVLTHSEIARAIEQELLRALIACLANPAKAKKPNPNRQRVIQRFHQLIEAKQYEPLYLPELCATVGVPERSLYGICKDYFGLSPQRYLWLRRMNLVRRALALADPNKRANSVTGIASDYGFTEFGRFSVQYRAMYGESPSATLRKSRVLPRSSPRADCCRLPSDRAAPARPEALTK